MVEQSHSRCKLGHNLIGDRRESALMRKLLSCNTHLNCGRRIIGVPEVVRLVSHSAGQMFSIGEETGCGKANMFVDRLYPAIASFDKKLGVKESLNPKDDTIVTTNSNSHTASLS